MSKELKSRVKDLDYNSLEEIIPNDFFAFENIMEHTSDYGFDSLAAQTAFIKAFEEKQIFFKTHISEKKEVSRKNFETLCHQILEKLKNLSSEKEETIKMFISNFKLMPRSSMTD